MHDTRGIGHRTGIGRPTDFRLSQQGYFKDSVEALACQISFVKFKDLIYCTTNPTGTVLTPTLSISEKVARIYCRQTK
jgi:hypothetical protein